MLSVSRLLNRTSSGVKTEASVTRLRAERPVVVWNITRSCGLKCAHCYNSSEHKAYPGELETKEALEVIDALAEFSVPAVILSGGDPLLRPDLFKLLEYASRKNLRTVLSSNGVTIDKEAARRIKGSGVTYVGVSLDGREGVNDRLRGVKGSYKKALEGLRRCRDLGLVTGIRFTMSRQTVGELPFIFDLLEKEDIRRGYFSHLVYSGRGERFSKEDLSHDETRRAVDYIFERAYDFAGRGLEKDIVTGSNDADGAYLYLKLKGTDPERADGIYKLLLGRGGNSSGAALGNIDNLGCIHADQFWRGHCFGNVRERRFGEVWTDLSDPLMRALKDRKGLIKGRCPACAFFDICGGNSRARAEFAAGDPWAEDPACYLTDKEIRVNRRVP